MSVPCWSPRFLLYPTSCQGQGCVCPTPAPTPWSLCRWGLPTQVRLAEPSPYTPWVGCTRHPLSSNHIRKAESGTALTPRGILRGSGGRSHLHPWPRRQGGPGEAGAPAPRTRLHHVASPTAASKPRSTHTSGAPAPRLAVIALCVCPLCLTCLPPTQLIIN